MKKSLPLNYFTRLAIFLAIMFITKYFFENFFEKYAVFHFNSLVESLLDIESGILSVLLKIFNFSFERSDTTFTFLNGHAMIVQTGCSGLKQLFQVFIAFLLIPGILKRKIWYIPSVMAIMFCATIMHLFILSFVIANKPELFQVTHVWVSRALFYSIMFITWLIWEEKVGFVNH